jgi:hypothetical protein
MQKAPEIWFEKLRDIWLKKDSEGIVSLMALDFAYFEDPFESPITDKEELIEVWQEVKQQDIELLDIQNLVSNDTEGSARYHFIAEINGEHHESKGVYYVKLNTDGEAMEFRQWWNVNDEN